MHHRPRPALSLAGACTRARDLLGAAVIAEAVGKSVSLVNAWCDAERPHQLPNIRHAVLIDQLCMTQAGERPIVETMRVMTEGSASGRPDLMSRIAELMGEVGDVARTARAALSDRRLTPAECARIAREVEEARAVLDRLQRELANAEVGR